MKLFRSFAVLPLFFVALVLSCAKNESPEGETADASGSFVGRVQYQGNSIEVDRDNRLMRVLRDGGTNTYKIEFYTGIPNITGVIFEKPNDSTWVSTDTATLKSVKISGKILEIDYRSNGESWVVEKAVRK
ncbi:hypothetical protein HX021_15760 [Sphingobacterium sp. N143]|uniref:hypothetical protein n=1 Tax=Sphingobacterium sp. N143 TaxID=2746727 RepID=UPI002576C4BE|nr:hypothetical protein [Sphingobacterium sp. N143]MDM1295746.1 hypothetical protein [Sphingobacterium sp. N143]